ncbi:hypothetical protein [Mycobacterium sp. URHB0044]|uniref:hypothetical protein n=1 Tax=Mycobacterium sp. URHB0044 TaxID=1380386 RepID=UPI001E5C21BB|nr:hypothetical protein [Mycobacterium sp. URHB0044]
MLTALEFVRAVQRCAGTTPHDSPEITQERLNFRLNYQKGLDEGWTRWAETGDWSAYVIAPTEQGLFEVLFARLPERTGARSESSRAVFSTLTDAAKLVMVSVLDSVRTNFGLDSLFVIFRSRGLDDRLVKSSAHASEIAPLVARLSPERAQLADQIQRISLREDPSTAALGFPGVEPYMNVLPLSLGEVAGALMSGLPAEVAECVDTFIADRDA